jgi:Uma2 family endonuclease
MVVANPQYDDVYRSMKPQHNAQRETIMTDMHGIPMMEEAFESLISVESPYRYELVDGLLYDMTGSTPEHTDLTFNIAALFKEQLGKGGPCRVYHDQYVCVPERPSVIPDVVVTCDVADRDKDKRLKPFKVRSPRIVVEVLSPSTERFDRTEKFARYMLCPTLEVYILINQYKQHVEVYQRATDWQQELYVADQTIHLNHLDLELPLDAIYEDVL